MVSDLRAPGFTRRIHPQQACRLILSVSELDERKMKNPFRMMTTFSGLGAAAFHPAARPARQVSSHPRGAGAHAVLDWATIRSSHKRSRQPCKINGRYRCAGVAVVVVVCVGVAVLVALAVGVLVAVAVCVGEGEAVGVREAVGVGVEVGVLVGNGVGAARASRWSKPPAR